MFAWSSLLCLTLRMAHLLFSWMNQYKDTYKSDYTPVHFVRIVMFSECFVCVSMVSGVKLTFAFDHSTEKIAGFKFFLERIIFSLWMWFSFRKNGTNCNETYLMCLGFKWNSMSGWNCKGFQMNLVDSMMERKNVLIGDLQMLKQKSNHV